MTAPPTVRRAAVLGSPIAHSLSPLLHRRAYDVLGLTGWSYDAFDVTEAELPEFLERLDETWAGLSLTMPLKSAILPMLSSRSPIVDAVGAANTVLLGATGRRGENTDVAGMAAACSSIGSWNGAEAAVLGGGATARSAVAALGELGTSVTAYVRSAARHNELLAVAEALDVPLQLRSWNEARDAFAAALVVNTTPAGAADGLVRALPPRPGVLFEVLYAPWPTPLAAAWRQRSAPVVGGLELLVQQAVRQIALMTEFTFDAEDLLSELREVGGAALR